MAAGIAYAQHYNADKIRQQVFGYHAERGRAEAAGSKIVFLVPYYNYLVAHKSAHGQPAHYAHGEYHCSYAGLEYIGYQYEHDAVGNIVQHVINFRKESIKHADISPQRAYKYAYERIAEANNNAYQQACARAVPYSGPKVLTG